MPERRARMLSVGEEPVVSVPVMAPENWMNEPAVRHAPAADTYRFLSQDEEAAEGAAEGDETIFFASSASPALATTVSVTASAMRPESAAAPEFGFEEPELVAAAQGAQFAAMAEEASYTPLPRDYASDFSSGACSPVAAEEHRAQAAPASFPESEEEAQRDLDTPTFLRRLRF